MKCAGSLYFRIAEPENLRRLRDQLQAQQVSSLAA